MNIKDLLPYKTTTSLTLVNNVNPKGNRGSGR